MTRKKIIGTVVSSVLLILAPAFGDAAADLLAAARKGDANAVSAALAGGASPDAATTYGVTGLLLACDKGHIEVARVLLEKGANPNAKDKFYGMQPLSIAVQNGHSEIIRLLLDRGAEGADEATIACLNSDKSAELLAAILASKKPSAMGLFKAMEAAKAQNKSELVDMLRGAGAKEPEAKAAVTVDSATLKRYEGKFRSAQVGMIIEFKAEENALIGSVEDQPDLTYRPLSNTEFESVEFQGIKVIFDSSNDAPVNKLRVEQGGQTIGFERVVEEKRAAEDLVPPSPSVEKKLDPRPSVTAAKNWPSFRGEGATGVADGQSPPAVWDASTSKNLVWKTPLPGLAHSCPVVWGDKVFVTTAVSSDANVFFKPGLYGDVDSVKDEPSHAWKLYCLDRRTGKPLWEKTANQGMPKVKRHLKGSHANCTPATDGKTIIAFFGSEGLYAYDMEGGLLWSRDLGVMDSGWFFEADYQWGFGSSPIVYRDMVIVQADVQEKPYIAAFDLATGKDRWRTPREEICSWGSPTVHVGKKRAELLTNGTKFVRGYDPETGKELWRLGRNSEITVPTPFVAHDMVYITSGYRPLQPIYAVRLGADGDITLPEGVEKNEHIAWSKIRGGPYMPTPIVYGDYLYTCQNQGIVSCMDARTGEQLYKERLGGKGGGFTASPVAGDGLVYFPSEDGEVFVLKAGPSYDLVAVNQVGETCMATPAISNGMIFIRGEKHLFAFGEPDVVNRGTPGQR